MLDPFQERYGIRVGGLMYIPAFLGELIWSAATLNSLSATISIVLNISRELSVAASACIAVFYTFLGGLWSVAYTDVAQLICMFIGMVSNQRQLTTSRHSFFKTILNRNTDMPEPGGSKGAIAPPPFILLNDDIQVVASKIMGKNLQ